MDEQSTVQSEMPKYKCHKEVHALKIHEVVVQNDGGAMITPAVEGFSAFRVSSGYIDRHNPKAGGYFVVYEDGYKSFSPAAPFEEGYTKI